MPANNQNRFILFLQERLKGINQSAIKMTSIRKRQRIPSALEAWSIILLIVLVIVIICVKLFELIPKPEPEVKPVTPIVLSIKNVQGAEDVLKKIKAVVKTGNGASEVKVQADASAKIVVEKNQSFTEKRYFRDPSFLQGVFIRQNIKVALVRGEIYQVGDTIEEGVIKEIDSESILIVTKTSEEVVKPGL